MNDLISRQAAIYALEEPRKVPDTLTDECAIGERMQWEKDVKALKDLPSAQPEHKWIPVKTRPMSDEEREHFSEYLDFCLDEDDAVMFASPMPDDGQEVWVCSKCGHVWRDTCTEDEGLCLEENGDWSDIVAWMPFERPEPYKGEE